MISTPASSIVCASCLEPLLLDTTTVLVCRFPNPAYDLVQIRCVVSWCLGRTNLFVAGIPKAEYRWLEFIALQQICPVVPPMLVSRFEAQFGFVPTEGPIEEQLLFHDWERSL